VMLGVFNLLPGFPLDGGRVLRSLIWAASGSLRRATEVASYTGQAFGFLLIFWGVSQVLGRNFLSGLWIGFIGWFLNNAAESTRQQQALQEGLRGARVAELMNSEPPTASPTMSVQEFVCDHVVQKGQRALLVVDGGRLLGLVSITDAKELLQAAWPTTSVGAIMTPTPLKTVTPDADVNGALQVMVEGGLNQLPVVRDSQLVGLLSRADIMRFLQLREDLGLQRLPADASRRGQSAPAR